MKEKSLDCGRSIIAGIIMLLIGFIAHAHAQTPVPPHIGMNQVAWVNRQTHSPLRLTIMPTPSLAPVPVQVEAVVINEVVTDPQRDWNDTVGGDGIPFNDIPGSGRGNSADEWVELLNPTQHNVDLTGWSLVMVDSTPATYVLGEGPAVLRFSAGGSLTDFRPGARLVIGHPKAALDNDVYIELRDAGGHVVDDVEIGDDFEEDGSDGAPTTEQNGNALTIYDEAIARVPDGWDSDDDRADFEKQPATISADNGQPGIGRLAQLPILNTLSIAGICEAFIDIQNVGALSAKAIVLFWIDSGACPPECLGPTNVTCTGLLKPGASWHLGREQIPRLARSGVVFSAFGQAHPAFRFGRDVFADALCQALFQARADCDVYRRFRKAFDQRGVWLSPFLLRFNFAAFPSPPIAVEVKRRCQSLVNPEAVGAYNGVGDQQLGRFDPQFGGFAYYAPLLYAGWRGLNSTLYIQNAGLECTSAELWFRTERECRRSVVCEIPAVAPGKSYRFSVNDCVGPGWVGNVWGRSSQPAAIIVDTASRDVLMTYRAVPAELNFAPEENTPLSDQPAAPLFTPGSRVNFGPLVYREHQGWDTQIRVQNLSSVLNAKIKVYFLDAGGDVIHTLVDWICPRSSRTFRLATISHLPGNWVGQVRVESQDWFSPGGSMVPAPGIVGIAQLVRWSGPAQVVPLTAMSYNLLSEEEVFDWQSGRGVGGLGSGAGLIGIPTLSSGLPDSGGWTSHLAIQNAVNVPGFTDFVLFLYDQNGVLDYVCQKLNARQVVYINLADWGYITPGFRGSAVISAVAWKHLSIDPGSGAIERNLLGLAAVKVEHPNVSDLLDEGAIGDEASASVGIPLAGPFNPGLGFDFARHRRPICPP